MVMKFILMGSRFDTQSPKGGKVEQEIGGISPHLSLLIQSPPCFEEETHASEASEQLDDLILESDGILPILESGRLVCVQKQLKHKLLNSKTRRPDYRIGRIHHPILESGRLVLLARSARSHRCRRRKARRRLKREPLNEKWRERCVRLFFTS